SWTGSSIFHNRGRDGSSRYEPKRISATGEPIDQGHEDCSGTSNVEPAVSIVAPAESPMQPPSPARKRPRVVRLPFGAAPTMRPAGPLASTDFSSRKSPVFAVKVSEPPPVLPRAVARPVNVTVPPVTSAVPPVVFPF